MNEPSNTVAHSGTKWRGNTRTRHYAITSYDLDFGTKLKDHTIRYAIWQKECCPKTNKMHLQCYVQLHKATRWGTIKKRYPKAHIEPCKGTPSQNREYCSKKDSRIEGPWEHGEFTGQGQRKDLEAVARMVESGRKLNEIAECYPVQFIKFHKGITALKNRSLERKMNTWRNVNVEILWGKTGTGKTRGAIEKCDDYYILENTGDKTWFDGYEGQDHLIIDEFYGWIKYSKLLRILDGHPLRVEVKGSTVPALWTKVTITSNNAMHTWYANIADQSALLRRISNTRYFY